MGCQASDAAAIERILRAEHGIDQPNEYLFEHERHADLVSALGLPSYAAGFGYRYMAASISAQQPLSSEFQSTGVAYEEPKIEVLGASEVDADVTVEVTRDTILVRLRGHDSPIRGESDLGTQLRAMAQVSASALILLRPSADLDFDRVSAVLASLQRAGFERMTFGSAPKQ